MRNKHKLAITGEKVVITGGYCYYGRLKRVNQGAGANEHLSDGCDADVAD